MKHYVKLILLVQFIASSASATSFKIVSESKHSTIDFCISELKTFLTKKNGFSYERNAFRPNWLIILKKDPSLSESGFSVKSYSKNKQQYIELIGASDKDIPCALYTFLEKLGYVFEIDGYFLAGKINPQHIINYKETIVPLAKYRGIRQHINFPMDISSYSLPDAKKYILNLVRMRFNFMAFHSYPGQWYEVKKNDTVNYAGNFFYGDRHDIPNNALIKKHIANKKTFVIPEIEPYFDDIPKKSQMARVWLNGVMNEAKRMGMKLQFSFEPRGKSTNVEQTVDLLKQISQQYPQVDAIEMITEESGGWGPRNTSAETKNILSSFFGQEALADTILTALIKPEQADLGYLYAQIGHVVKTMDAVKKQGLSLPPLKLGIYCTNQYNRVAYHLASKFLPDAQISLLPAHGSANVAKNIANILTKENDWYKTTIYSWLEFDGMMYLQQDGIKGIYQLIKQKSDNAPAGQLNAIAFNHWRTSENKITARYAALATIYGAEEPALFYKGYAKKMGIVNPEMFSNAMRLLQEAFDSHTLNIGFAWKGYWKKGFIFFPEADLTDMLQRYEKTKIELNKCSFGNNTPYGKNTVQFLDNRLRATMLYLKAFSKANELKVAGISNKRYNETCDEVLAIFDECLKVYAEMMPDRGCEGTLINMYLSPVNGIKISRQKKTGVPLDAPLKSDSHFDAPAPPIFKGGN